jgi:GTPase SAR1 family protein
MTEPSHKGVGKTSILMTLNHNEFSIPAQCGRIEKWAV